MTEDDFPAIGYQEGRSDLNNVIAFLDRQRERDPARTSLMWVRSVQAWFDAPNSPPAHDSMSAGALGQAVESAAAGLKRLGLAPGDRVFIFVPMSPALYIAMFAVQRLGAIAVFLDSWARRDQLGLCAKQVVPKGFIGPEPAFGLTRGIPELETVAVRVVVGPHEGAYSAALETLAGRGEACGCEPVEREDTALVTFTTGSSGPPKGANRTHRFLAAQHRALDRCLPYARSDIDLPVFPIFSLNNMAGGVTTVLPAIDLARPAGTDGALLAAQLRATRATCCTLSPSLLRAVAAAAGQAGIELDGLRRMATGGAPVSADDIAAIRAVAPRAALHILYGSTEVEPIAHLVASDMPAGGEAEGVCVGALAEGLQARFLRLNRGPVQLGEDGWTEWELPAGRTGELAVSGEHVCRDYYKNPDAFQRAKIVDADGQVWHRTGDMCRLDEDGRLWVVGRVHNVIRRKDDVLFPVKPEILMKRLPFVQAAAYLGMPDTELGERAVAAFSVRPGRAPADFAAAIRDALAKEGVVVDDVVQVDDIPLDPRHHSKVEYEKLRERLGA
ncbi:MAG: AMP-binding protein [Kiritimatiellae bacterium]|nr:AMP-binding protein [Kiritimatiellia bacterium]